jgi:thioredoxin-like negative regulator of GroEL
MDADSHRKLAQPFGIQGFPTIKLLKNGKPFKDYEGPRTQKVK